MRRSLENTLQTLNGAGGETPGVSVQDIDEGKLQLLDIMEGQYMEALVRNREKRLEQDEQPSKVFRGSGRGRGNHTEVYHAGTKVAGQRGTGEDSTIFTITF